MVCISPYPFPGECKSISWPSARISSGLLDIRKGLAQCGKSLQQDRHDDILINIIICPWRNGVYVIIPY